MKRHIILSGALGKQFGRDHYFDIATPAEAIRALTANFDQFTDALVRSQEQNVGYKVLADQDLITEMTDLYLPFSKTVRIVPVVGGAKSGIGGIILGAALVAAAFYTGGASLTATGIGFSGLAGQMAFGIGTSLLLSGVSSLLSPMPKAGKPQEAVQNDPSYSFNGPINTTSQGQPVPVGYGRLIVGSAVISAGITADDYAAAGVA